jgi:hypothetical protein
VKLCDWMRLGAMSSPPRKDGLMDGDGRCALSAAADAMGIAPIFLESMGEWSVNYAALSDRFPILEGWVIHPVKGEWRSLTGVIFSLNDTCGWTREQIAEWVETLETPTNPVVVTRPAMQVRV